MIANEVLAKGVEEGIITAEQARRLMAMERDQSELPPSPDDKQLRFVSGFNDVFVAIGLAMFLGAIGYFAMLVGDGQSLGIVVAATSWLLAEFFTRRRRMALPSIILLVVFAYSVFVGAAAAMSSWQPSAQQKMLFDPSRPTTLAVGAFCTVLAVAVHYWRFRVPITVAAGCAALTAMVVSLSYGFAPNLAPVVYDAIVFCCGLAVFALAMQFDMTDTERLTRRTDIAFWLHLLAAPLIVHSMTRGLVTDVSKLDLGTAAIIIAIFLAMSFVAVLIDRRAMLVSGLSYAAVALGTLISGAGISNLALPVTLLVLGMFVLLLSAGWRPLRKTVLNVVPLAVARHLPQTGTSA